MHAPTVVRLLIAIVSLQLVVAGDSNGAPPEWTTQKQAVQRIFEEIYPVWFQIHSAAAHKRVAEHADIVIDPERGLVTLDRDGDEPPLQVELPSGMKWHAFQFSVHGVRKLSFPVVLQRPNHHEPRSVQDDEEILIIGDARKTQLSFHIGSRITGVTGGGMDRGWNVSKPRLFQVNMPVNDDDGFRSQVSMLPATVRLSQPTEFIVADGTRVEVTRLPSE